MSALDTKHFLLLVVKLLLIYVVISKPNKSGKSCIKRKIENDTQCSRPSGYSTNTILENRSQAVSCNDPDWRVLMILAGNVSNITLNKDVLSEQDFILMIQTENQLYQCVSVLKNVKGYCWKEGNTTKIECNNILSSPSSCKNFVENESLIIRFNATPVCEPCEEVDTGNANNVPDVFDSLVPSYKENFGNSTTLNITAGKITGMLVKLEKATDINVGITTSGATKILQGSQGDADLFCSVEIPAEATDMAISENGTLAAVLRFPNIKSTDPNSVFFNNTVLAVDMEAKISNLSQPIKLQFNNVDKKGRNVSCVSWNGEGSPNWTTDGCSVEEIKSSITCECYHLTFFALLMSSSPQNISSSDYNALSSITSVGCGLSMLFLAVGLFMHCLIRKGKASQGTQLLMNLFVAMFMLDLSFLVNESIANLDDHTACVATAAVMHYTMLATISWFFVEAVHLYYVMWKSPNVVKHYMVKTGIVGWGTPAIVVIGLLAMQKYDLLITYKADGTTSKLCWIPDAVILQGVNIGYYSVVFIFTFGIFIATVRQVVLFEPQANKAQRKLSVKSKSFSILGLLFLLGITWAVAFFSYGVLLIPSYYIFTILNSFQGFFLFIYYYNTSKIVVDEMSLKFKVSSTYYLGTRGQHFMSYSRVEPLLNEEDFSLPGRAGWRAPLELVSDDEAPDVAAG